MRNEFEVFNRYGTNDWEEIAQMYASDPNPGTPLEDIESSSMDFWNNLHWDRPKPKLILRGGPRVATPRIDTESAVDRAGSSDDQPLSEYRR